jgi:hypothetical protein
MMMVSNSTNIIKTNNYMYLSSQVIKHKRHMLIEIKILSCDRHRKVVGLNQFMGFQSSSF